MAKRTSSVAMRPTHNHDHDYSGLLAGVTAAFTAATTGHSRLFLTDAAGLNDLYLSALPAAERQVHNCHACRRFIETYGALAAITENGELVPAIWGGEDPLELPAFYHDAFSLLRDTVKRASVTSVFYTKQTVWGTPVTGAWSHPAVTPPAALVYREGALTAGQAMAASVQDYQTVMRAIGEFRPPLLDEALRILNADALARSERFIGPVRWLRALHQRPRGRRGENVVWRAVATAPAGYCHPRSSVIAPLLENLAAGLPFEDGKAKFDAMMHPLRYQRPQAAPTAGNVKAAEALVEKLGIARSLERRFARLDEIKTVWTAAVPAPAEGTSTGVFAHLKTKADVAAPPVTVLPARIMTWDKFARTVLPDARRLHLRVPGTGNFEAYLTAAHSDAPLIFKWPNPFSSYVYHNGSPATQWRLTPLSWAEVLAVSPRSHAWEDPQAHLGGGMLLVLAGAGDTRSDQGNALFPETLRADLHAVRATIEAYSKRAAIGPAEGQLACGYGIGKAGASCALRVNGTDVYTIDRWD